MSIWIKLLESIFLPQIEYFCPKTYEQNVEYNSYMDNKIRPIWQNYGNHPSHYDNVTGHVIRWNLEQIISIQSNASASVSQPCGVCKKDKTTAVKENYNTTIVAFSNFPQIENQQGEIIRTRFMQSIVEK